jgi:branched-chain amino acid transport system substrate-binding protein
MSNRLSSKAKGFAGIALVSLLIFGLSTPAAAQTLKIGIIGPLSGPGAVWGQQIVRGAEMASEEISAKGGLPIGNEKYSIKLIPYDDKYKGPDGLTAANKLVFDDKVKVILGSISSASILAFQVVTEPNKVLVLCNSFSHQVLDINKPYTFRILMTSLEKAPLEVGWVAKERPKVKNVITWAPNDVSGWDVTKHYLKAFNSNGINVLLSEYYERGTKDFYPILTRIKAKNPDLLYSCGSPPGDVALMVKQARELGMKCMIMGHAGSVEDPEKFVGIAGKKSAEEYTYGTDFNFISQEPRAAQFIEKYVKKYGHPCYGYVDPCFYDAVMALSYAIQKVGALDSDKIRDMLSQISDYQGVMGPFKFSGKGDYGIDRQRMTTCFIAQIKDGKQVILSQVR